ncbi:MAG: hypothetical protein AAF515_17990 [Pseudomonadota bacterium]
MASDLKGRPLAALFFVCCSVALLDGCHSQGAAKAGAPALPPDSPFIVVEPTADRAEPIDVQALPPAAQRAVAAARSALGRSAHVLRADAVRWSAVARDCALRSAGDPAGVAGHRVTLLDDGIRRRYRVVGDGVTGCGQALASTSLGNPRLAPRVLQDFERRATDDLSARLRIEVADIAAEPATVGVWPDRGLGCPESGQTYLPEPVHGARLLLRVGPRTYDYRTDGQVIVRCWERRAANAATQ